MQTEIKSKSEKRIRTILFFILPTLILVILTSYFFTSIKHDDEEIAKASLICETYFMQKQSKDYTTCYRNLDSKFRQVIHENDYINFEAELDQKLGLLKSLDIVNIQFRWSISGYRCQIAYLGKFERGNALAYFTLRRSSGVYRIIDIRYTSLPPKNQLPSPPSPSKNAEPAIQHGKIGISPNQLQAHFPSSSL